MIRVELFFVVVYMLSVGVMIGFFVGVNTYSSDTLKECAKQHNVYECELVAVPVEGEL